MKKSIIKKLIILLLFSVNADSLKEKLDRCTLPLQTVNPQAFQNNPTTIKIQSVKIEYLSVNTIFANHIDEQSILKSVKEIKDIPTT